ncbi:MAG TPA: tRNA uridine-5-carboxymethylaminomethyl(34) synthesis GTPase MnmE [Rhizomicrobium sp.]|nr:tRNA uridine-5-carboxymethylaminomethyl(34) synthesis GTPase MnmE [Rhizomicrobium sp.]
MSDTIFALSSGAGRAGVAVIRVSGPGSRPALEALAGRGNFQPRRAIRASLNKGGEPIDDALVLWFPGPASFSGEDLVEFHVHGGRAVIEAMLSALAALPGLRPAEPGEFTRRAVENGKFDLTRAEALADLIDAETEAQRRQALRQYDGALATLYDGWRDRLIRACAWVEAAIDFSDEKVPDDVVAESRLVAVQILEEIQSHLADGHNGEIIRNGVHLTVFGKTNVGKSSLVNALAKRDVAIVSPTPGTTRDVIEVHLDLGGYQVILSDTAGLREPGEAVEAEGVRRALERVASADISLLVLDGTEADLSPAPPADLTIWNKADLPWPAVLDGLRVSAKTGEGLDALVAALTKLIAEKLAVKAGSPPLTRVRHRRALEQAAAALARALETDQTELMAEDFRLALRALGRITGRVDIEELLDVVFRDFCIGK